MKRMTILGVGPKWAAFVIAYGVIAAWAGIRFSLPRILDQFSLAVVIVGTVLMAIGALFYAFAARAIVKGFPTDQLLTRGVYGICRHPVYGSWIVFILPGTGLILRTWLSLSTCVVAYVLLRMMVKEEESYLAARFGDEYTHYRQRTPFVLPIGFIKKRESRLPNQAREATATAGMSAAEQPPRQQ